MLPLTHIYLAKKYFRKLTDEIKFGAIAPDLLSAAALPRKINSHIHLKDFKYPNFQQAYNVCHVDVDSLMEPKYCDKIVTDKQKEMYNVDLRRNFAEATFERLLYNEGVYYSFPNIGKGVKEAIEDYFNQKFIFEKFAEHFAHWKKKTYPKFIIKLMHFACGLNKTILTTSQIEEEIQTCANNWQIYLEKNNIKNYQDLLDKVSAELKD